MAGSRIAEWTAQLELSARLRYGLAFASVAVALLLELAFRHFRLADPLTAFALAAIAVAFGMAAQSRGIVAAVLASLIRGYLFEAGISGLAVCTR